jgi:hypothetical protein
MKRLYQPMKLYTRFGEYIIQNSNKFNSTSPQHPFLPFPWKVFPAISAGSVFHTP